MAGYPMDWHDANASSVVDTQACLYTSSGIVPWHSSNATDTCQHQNSFKTNSNHVPKLLRVFKILPALQKCVVFACERALTVHMQFQATVDFKLTGVMLIGKSMQAIVDDMLVGVGKCTQASDGNERGERFYVRAAPWECGHARRLRDERRADFVTESAHGPCWWPQKQNAARLQRVRKLRILGCVTPSWPHRLHPCPLRNLLAIEIQIRDHLH